MPCPHCTAPTCDRAPALPCASGLLCSRRSFLHRLFLPMPVLLCQPDRPKCSGLTATVTCSPLILTGRRARTQAAPLTRAWWVFRWQVADITAHNSHGEDGLASPQARVVRVLLDLIPEHEVFASSAAPQPSGSFLGSLRLEEGVLAAPAASALTASKISLARIGKADPWNSRSAM